MNASDIIVPPPPWRGRPRVAPVGLEEGDLCLRSVDGQPCAGKIVLRPDEALQDGCSCHIAPPCGYCTSTMPECPACGWRLEE